MLSVRNDGEKGASSPSRFKRHNILEQGRADALDMLIRGCSLQEVLSQVIVTLEEAISGLKCCIMLVNETDHSLFPFVAPSLSDAFLSTLQSVFPGPESASCGIAAYRREPVVTDQEHPVDLHYRRALKQADLKTCWSSPIVSPAGELFGTFCMYFSQAVEPEEADLDLLHYEANVVSLVLERAKNIEQLKQANNQLELRVAERTRELTEANMMLKRALEQRNEVQSQLVEMENMAALGTMMSSLTHEINTPVGVAITAVSHLRKLQQDIACKLDNDSLKRSELTQFLLECDESSDIAERNLVRSTQLIKTFKQLSIDQHSQDARKINLCGYIFEILLSLKPRLKRTRHLFCVDVDPELCVSSNPGALSQLLINFIMNSAQHGYEQDDNGHIYIGASCVTEANDAYLRIVYRDDGRGMTAHTLENLYKPFFTMARSTGGSGLGMHICYNLVVKVLAGRIDCRSEPGQGVEFVVTVPLK